MDLEKQVVSVEIAQRLKELGVRQESLWYWVHPWQKTKYIERKNRWILTLEERVNDRINYSAFTVAELGEILPKTKYILTQNIEAMNKKIPYDFTQVHRDDGITLSYKSRSGISSCRMTSFNEFSEANIRGKMLIYLMEE